MTEVPVAVVTEPGAADGAVADPLADADADVREVSHTDVATGALDDARVVVAVGEASLLAVARRTPTLPVAPVDAGTGRYDIPAAALPAVVDAAARGALETVRHPVLGVSVAGDRSGAAVADVTLLTADPARISEFGVGSDDGWAETVRADGVVVATPLGSAGYARAAGGPALAPDTGVVAAPISAYAMHVRPWVLRPPVSLSVVRDEARVTLRLDDEEVRTVPPDAPVDVVADGSVELVAPQQFPET